MAGLYKSLKVEDFRRVSSLTTNAPAPLYGNGKLNWKQRLGRVMNFPGTTYTQRMLDLVCTPAMQEVAKELSLRGANVEFNILPPAEDERLNHLELVVDLGKNRTLSIKFGRNVTLFPPLPTEHVQVNPITIA